VRRGTRPHRGGVLDEASQGVVGVEFAPRALRQAAAARKWWSENRPDAPECFDQELAVVVDQIKVGPQIGNVYQVESSHVHRRLLMPVTRFHVYYRVLSPELVRIVAIWSGVRERGPRI
jgi:plasmid stabilization system protein ParE